MSYQRFSLLLSLTTLTVVSVLTSFIILTIIQANNNSTFVIQKILDRLDRINNATLQQQAYSKNVQEFTILKILQLLNNTGSGTVTIK